ESNLWGSVHYFTLRPYFSLFYRYGSDAVSSAAICSSDSCSLGAATKVSSWSTTLADAIGAVTPLASSQANATDAGAASRSLATVTRPSTRFSPSSLAQAESCPARSTPSKSSRLRYLPVSSPAASEKYGKTAKSFCSATTP